MNVIIDRLEQASGQSTDSYTDHEQKNDYYFFNTKERRRRKKEKRVDFRFRIDAAW